MDFLVSQCELLGLKLVLPFVNTWPDWGGVKVYREAFTEDWSVMWYDIPEAQQIYKDFVKVMVTRYKKSSAIFSWQLGNEPRCELCGNTDVVYKWYVGPN
jgi:mannan endo-1,4-beta-mannosidase